MTRAYEAASYGMEDHGNQPQQRQRHGSPIFYGLLQSMAELHDRKSHDYASNNDPYGNYRFAGQIASMFSHSPEDMGFVGRLAEKIYRLANLERDGKIPKNETIEDTELDICVIVALWMSARRDKRMKEGAKQPSLSPDIEKAFRDIDRGLNQR